MTLRIFTVVACLAIVAPARAQQATQSFDSNGVHIQYLDKGRGAPVVLLHGFTGSYARHWEAPGVIGALESAGYRVFAMVWRGRGKRGKPHDAGQYGLEMVQDVLRLLDHLHIDRAHIVGYSMGGWIAAQMLVRHPSRVKTVTFLGAGWEGDDTAVIRSLMTELADGFAKRDDRALVARVTSNGPNTPAPTAAEIP